MNLFAKINALLLVALCAVCSATLRCLAQNNPSVPRAPKSWALVIGINKYPKLPGGQQLMFADKDAAAFSEAMKKICGDNIRTFINQEATLSAIKEAVGNWLARLTIEGDTVYIYFSGHGIVETEYGESYLLAYDSDANQLFASALSLRELRYALGSRVRANRVLILADAVRRDFFEPDTGGIETSKTFSRSFDQLAESRPGISVMLANAPGEYTREGQRWNAHSVFTKYLLDAIAGDADLNRDGAITAEEVFNFVSPRVASDTSNKQHPSHSGITIAEITIARNAANLAIAKTAEPVKNTAPPVLAKAEPKGSEKPLPSTPAPVAKSEPAKSVPVSKAEKTIAAGQTPINAVNPIPDKTSSNPVTPTAKLPSPPSTEKNNPVVSSPPALPPATKKEKKSESGKPRELIAESSKPTSQPTPEASKPPIESPAENKPTSTETKAAPKAVEVTAAPKPVEKPAPPKPALPTPPSIKTTQPISIKAKTPMPDAPLATNLPTPPAPVRNAPKLPAITESVETAPKTQPAAASASLPVTEVAAPSPLPSQFEMAIAAGRIVEPRGNNAWEFFQEMNTQPATTADAARLKPHLVEALIRAGKEVVSGDVRGDNITDRVDDFKRAGQLFAKGKSLSPENKDLPMLEKLSAAEALIALQFYDEAERALSQMPPNAAAANAFGIVYTGKLDYWKAERAYKDAIEMEPNWFAPHYNLGLLYRIQKNDTALASFERAAGLNDKNEAVWLALGDEHFSQNHWQQAAEAYRKAIALKPNDDNLHTKLGHALYSQGLRDEANREYQKAKELRGRQ